jgi:hypothetical protein
MGAYLDSASELIARSTVLAASKRTMADSHDLIFSRQRRGERSRQAVSTIPPARTEISVAEGFLAPEHSAGSVDGLVHAIDWPDDVDIAGAPKLEDGGPCLFGPVQPDREFVSAPRPMHEQHRIGRARCAYATSETSRRGAVAAPTLQEISTRGNL